MKTIIKKSRKEHKCYACDKIILKGKIYKTITLFPHEEPYLSDFPIQKAFCYPICKE